MVYVPVLIEVRCQGTIMRRLVRAGWISAEIVDSLNGTTESTGG